ncbi:hypothetical protein DEU40_108118 [Chryseobacterium sp. AG844]|nr:hypothetical protein DEU40_108118 [Chryseobacterium sp. AG844]
MQIYTLLFWSYYDEDVSVILLILLCANDKRYL